jgi:hypothetical protein
MLLGFEIGQRWPEAVMHSCGSYFVPVPKLHDRQKARALLNHTLLFHYLYKYGDIVIPKIEGTEPLPMELNHFIDCIMSNKEPISNGISGLHVVKILEAAQRSLDKGNSRGACGRGSVADSAEQSANGAALPA